jgi:hypothetical protein
MKTKPKNINLLLPLLLFLFLQFSCSKPNEPNNSLLTLTVEDVSCIEA